MTWTIMTISLVGLQILIAALSWPMATRRVRPNAMYGFRTPATLSDDRVWYEANAASGRYLLAATAFSALLSLITYFVLPPATFATAGFIIWAVGLLIATVMSFVALRRITRA